MQEALFLFSSNVILYGAPANGHVPQLKYERNITRNTTATIQSVLKKAFMHAKACSKSCLALLCKQSTSNVLLISALLFIA